MTEEPIYLDVLADQESDYQTLPEISFLDDAIDPANLAALPTPLSPSSDYQTLPEISFLDDAIDPAILAALATPLCSSSK